MPLMPKTGSPILQSVFYWLGVVLAMAFVLIILAGPKALLGRYQLEPLTWSVAGLAALSFAACEYCSGRHETAAKPAVPQASITPEGGQRTTMMQAVPDDGKNKDLEGLPAEVTAAVAALKESRISDNVVLESRHLLPEHAAALSLAMDLMDEALQRLVTGDRRTAILLIRDSREQVRSLFVESRQEVRTPVRAEEYKLGS